jgi:hypothetical protein
MVLLQTEILQPVHANQDISNQASGLSLVLLRGQPVKVTISVQVLLLIRFQHHQASGSLERPTMMYSYIRSVQQLYTVNKTSAPSGQPE